MLSYWQGWILHRLTLDSQDITRVWWRQILHRLTRYLTLTNITQFGGYLKKKKKKIKKKAKNN